MELNKLRISYLKKIIKLNPFLRLQCTERIQFKSKNQDKKDLSNILATKILNSSNKEYHTLIKYNRWLRTSIENDELSEYRIDLDNINFEENLNVAREINKILVNNGIKANIYATGSKGLHIQFLFNIQQFKLNIQLKDIDLNEYETGFKNKQNRNEAYNKIIESSNERREVKRHILKELGIDIKNFNIDDRVFLSTQQLGLETGTHRKTNKRKTLIQYINLPNEKIINFIENNNNFFIDWKYLDRINKIPESIINNYKSNNMQIFNKSDKVTKNQNKELNIQQIYKKYTPIINKSINETQWIKICCNLNELIKNKHHLLTNGSWENFGWYLCNFTYNQFKEQEEFEKNLQILIKILNIDYKKTWEDIFSNLKKTFNENMFFGKYKDIITLNDYNKLFI